MLLWVEGVHVMSSSGETKTRELCNSLEVISNLVAGSLAQYVAGWKCSRGVYIASGNVRMKLLSSSVLLLAASAAARRVSERATGPFFQKLDNATWVIGNEIWNMTQQYTYGVKLFYQGHDCVGDAVGHYVSYSK